MKILALNPTAFVGGAEISLVDVLDALKARGHQIVLACPPGGSLESLARNRALEVADWCLPASLRRVGRNSPARTLGIALAGACRSGMSLVNLIRVVGPDVVYSNGIKSHLLASAVYPRFRVPIVWHVRDFVSARRVAVLLFAAARFARVRVIANSGAVAAEWREKGIKVTVIYNGFRPVEAFHPTLPSRSAPVRLIAAGILAPWKGFDVILRACALLPGQLSWRLTICGDEIYETHGHTGERDRLSTLASTLGLQDRVTFQGMVPDLLPYFQQSDILLHGSIRPEPFGRVVAEAMLSFLPVIASNGGGIPEFVRNGIDGLLYEMGSADRLSEAIATLASDPILRRQMGTAGQKRISRDFSIVKTAAEVEQELASACRGKGRISGD
jgi:glycosyltransferase involved in cell wall biosynthesis